MSDTQPLHLSLVIPCYNEADGLPELLKAIPAALDPMGKPYEVLIVDDGSTDASPQILKEAMATRPWLRVIRLTPNCGQSAAFEAGFAAAQGELIATIDADLQNDPAEIPRMIPMLEAGPWGPRVDMVTGWRKKRQDPWIRTVQTKIANGIRNSISQETIQDSASSLKVYRAYTLKRLRLWRGAHRFFPTLVKMQGYTCREVEVSHRPRFAGSSKYPFGSRVLRAFVDLLAVRWMKSRFLRYTASEVSR
jgi:dolichol-phosphate mannosyltransferase